MLKLLNLYSLLHNEVLKYKTLCPFVLFRRENWIDVLYFPLVQKHPGNKVNLHVLFYYDRFYTLF